MVNSKFSLMLRMYRENAGLTQKQVAEALGMERSTYAYYETGTSNPSGEMILRLSAIFHIDYSVFMEAIGDTSFDNNPEDEQFTTLNDDSWKQREKLYSVGKREQNLILRYRALDEEKKQRLDDYLLKLHSEGKPVERRGRGRKKPM